MPSKVIEVGKTYPALLPDTSHFERWPRTLWPHLTRKRLNLVVMLSELQEKDRKAFREQPIRVEVNMQESVPLVTVGVEGWGCLTGLPNAHDYKNDRITGLIESIEHVWFLVITEGHGRKRIVRQNRTFSVQDSLVSLMKKGLKMSLKKWENSVQVESTAWRVLHRHDQASYKRTEKQVFEGRFWTAS